MARHVECGDEDQDHDGAALVPAARESLSGRGCMRRTGPEQAPQRAEAEGCALPVAPSGDGNQGGEHRDGKCVLCRHYLQ